MRFGVLVMAVILLGGFIFWKDITTIVKGSKVETVKEKESREDNEAMSTASAGVNVIQRWDLPSELKEVSGISYMAPGLFASVQDEEGTIYVYNTNSNSIEKKIPFAAPGDFEDISIVNNIAYIIRADGTLFEVDMDRGKSSVKEYKTGLTVEQNIEGLTYDKTGNRLLLAIKDEDRGSKKTKGIYSFDLGSKTLATAPVYNIDLHDPLLQTNEGKKKKTVKPSAIAIHPNTNEILVIDGPKSRLLVMDKDGKLSRVMNLGKDFEQPEGITFSPDGELFISNEGKDKAGNIMKVELK